MDGLIFPYESTEETTRVVESLIEEVEDRFRDECPPYAFTSQKDQIVQALRLRIPEKPRFELKIVSIKGYSVQLKRVQCPCCDLLFGHSGDDFVDFIFNKRYRHCPNCGKAIDWSDI